MNLSDYIANMILEIIDECGTADIARNDLANKIGCVPSQISYVITSRFTPENGYIVESRRGGGGYIKIKKVSVSQNNIIMHVVNCIGDEVDENSCRAILRNLYNEKAIGELEYKIINSVILNNTLKDVPIEFKDKVRANILKNALISISEFD